ncbi:MAG: hypothetical protein SF070_13730 [Gemmatimonadota bacterium]|nr:hypothetical protein [Gemmatimonadota bacterium]
MPASRLLLLLLAGGLLHPAQVVAQTAPSRQVIINRGRVPDATLARLEAGSTARIPDGRYWYDRVSGAWGLEGGHTRGFTAPGLDLGGRLPADISGGGTGVFINGREIHPLDLVALQHLVGQVAPGRYWLDGQGYAGFEGGPAIANLMQVAQQLYRQNGGVGENYGGGAGAYHNPRTGIGIITDGQGGAGVFGP